MPDEIRDEQKQEYEEPSLLDLEDVAGGSASESCGTGGSCCGTGGSAELEEDSIS